MNLNLTKNAKHEGDTSLGLKTSSSAFKSEEIIGIWSNRLTSQITFRARNLHFNQRGDLGVFARTQSVTSESEKTETKYL